MNQVASLKRFSSLDLVMQSKLTVTAALSSILLASTISAKAAAPPDTAGTIPVPKGEVEVTIDGGGIPTKDMTGVLNPDGVSARVSVTLKPIPRTASTDSPHCAPYRVGVAGLYLPVEVNRMANCLRVCIKPPEGSEINASNGLSGTLSQDWSAIFNTEWYPDTKIMCGHIKTWSANSDLVATLTVSVCPAGSGCSNTAPPVPTPVTIVPTTREREPSVSPMSRRLRD